MPADNCPTFEKTGDGNTSLVGMWMQFPQNLKSVPLRMEFAGLGYITEMAARYFSNEPNRIIPNNLTSIGGECSFSGGAFVMGHDYPAPNEPDGYAEECFDYRMTLTKGTNDGEIMVCIREPRSKTPQSNNE